MGYFTCNERHPCRLFPEGFGSGEGDGYFARNVEKLFPFVPCNGLAVVERAVTSLDKRDVAGSSPASRAIQRL